MGDALFFPKRRAVATGEFFQRDSGGQDVHGHTHTVSGELFLHGGGGYDNRIERVVLAAGGTNARVMGDEGRVNTKKLATGLQACRSNVFWKGFASPPKTVAETPAVRKGYGSHLS
ncbi:hypothetical protein AGMMS49545_19970 [Betaproteobacteria bacterium]|nr:hypothetical protein AGMMS49545_19970 [Betaproteobacteria bacterium]